MNANYNNRSDGPQTVFAQERDKRTLLEERMKRYRTSMIDRLKRRPLLIGIGGAA